MSGGFIIAELFQKVVCAHTPCCSKGRDTLFVPAGFDHDLTHLRMGKVFIQLAEIISFLADLFSDRTDIASLPGFIDIDRHLFGLKYMLVSRLACIIILVIDVILHHRVDQAGDIPPQVDVFPDSG